MAPLVVITGPPGAGKSTVARELAARFEPSALVEGDAFFAFIAEGFVAPWLAESDKQNRVVIEAAAAAAGRLATGGYTTVYDGVLGPWFLHPFFVAAGVAELDYVLLLPPVDQCLEQIAGREDHPFRDEDAARKMHDEFARAPLDPRHVVGDLGSGVGDVVERIVVGLGDGGFRWSGR